MLSLDYQCFQDNLTSFILSSLFSGGFNGSNYLCCVCFFASLCGELWKWGRGIEEIKDYHYLDDSVEKIVFARKQMRVNFSVCFQSVKW
jgi:hypothetical protein